MKVLAITAAKGGVGKSTVAVHMAALAQSEGVETVVVDLDDQSSKHWGEAREATGKDKPLVVTPRPSELSQVLDAARAEGMGLVIIDTPPKATADISPAATAADFALVPTRPGPFDLRAVERTLDLLKATRTRYAVVLNHVPPTSRTIAEEAQAFLGDVPMAPVALAQRVAFSHALIGGESVTEFEPDGRAAAEMRALWAFVKGELFNGNDSSVAQRVQARR